MQPGTYSYQFLVDGSWMTSPDAPVAPDEDGHLCNRVSSTAVRFNGGRAVPRSRKLRWDCCSQILVDAPPAFHIYYATGWDKVVLHVRELKASGEPMNQVTSTCRVPNACTCLLVASTASLCIA